MISKIKLLNVLLYIRAKSLMHNTVSLPSLICVVFLFAVSMETIPHKQCLAQILETDQEQKQAIEFFESNIRPVLIEHCYSCHNSTGDVEGGLILDHRKALLKGGEGGAVLIPHKPEESRILSYIRHDIQGKEMPQGGPKLDKKVIQHFTTWIAKGAVDPRDAPPTKEEIAQAETWENKLKKRKEWWSFQPIKRPKLPTQVESTWSHNPIDQLISLKWKEHGLEPASPASPEVLVRRLFFNLIGLPPQPEELHKWTTRLNQSTDDDHQKIVEELVDTLLQSPHFGERWARHWMDWIRYAESHGSEGDPLIDQAWVYRDYLIRAFNQDVPLDQMLREHVAGDLLENPRINKELAINESIIGTAQWRMVFHGFTPTDPLDEKVRFIDDQVNTFSKAFLGLTVSCARCHDHKFDAISQKDYYALFGILGSCRQGRNVIDAPEKLNFHKHELTSIKTSLRNTLAADWLESLPGLDEKLLDLNAQMEIDNSQVKKAKAAAAPKNTVNKKNDLLNHLVLQLQKEMTEGASFSEVWEKHLNTFLEAKNKFRTQQQVSTLHQWNMADKKDYQTWFTKGNGLPTEPSVAGEFAVAPRGDTVIFGVYPAGVFSHLISTKHAARLMSGDFVIGPDDEIWLQTLGNNSASARYVVQDYPRKGTVYPVSLLTDQWNWLKFNLDYWEGESIYLELATARDAPLLTNDPAESWFGIRQVSVVKKGTLEPANYAEFLEPVYDYLREHPPKSIKDVANAYVQVVTDAIQDWQHHHISDQQALLLDSCVKQGLLPNKLESLSYSRELILAYRKLESEIPIPQRVPGLDESIGADQPLYARGNHKQPQETVPRRFLESIDGTPYKSQLSGRMQLAEDLLRADNPLTRRVLVNHLWHHVFGEGIVRTPDNFGRLGDIPSHPELLDWLALTLPEDGWSLKRMVRLMVTSKTWQLSSDTSPSAHEKDPENRLLSHAHIRRLEAETIRDLLLSVSGTMERRLYGPPVDQNNNRRSIYLNVKRNSLNPFLRTFDFPEPFSSVGRRDVTNVPAQSLTMLNDPQVTLYAHNWLKQLLQDQSLSTSELRIKRMFETAFHRPATSAEITLALEYLQQSKLLIKQQQAQIQPLLKQIAELEISLSELISTARKRLQIQSKTESLQSKNTLKPLAAWDFSISLEDQVGSLHCELVNGARIQNGVLVLQNNAYVITKPVKQSIREKTMLVWVKLNNLEQQGGGVMSIQATTGGIFDAIVYGEREPRKWISGSNFFKRTQDFKANKEQKANREFVSIAITYDQDGHITAYRDGKPYGASYQTEPIVEFKSEEAVITFGIRHLPAGGNKMLDGEISRAMLFDRALSAEEVLSVVNNTASLTNEKLLINEFTSQEMNNYNSLQQEIFKIKTRLEAFGPATTFTPDEFAWTELVRSLFLFKEFLYVR